MFLVHYAHRAVISPLVLAPKRNPQHIWVTSASVFFNLLNGYMIGTLSDAGYDEMLKPSILTGSFIASDPLPETAFHTARFWLCAIGWLVGFLGNGKPTQHITLLTDRRL